MKTAFSAEATGANLEADVRPALTYTPATLSIRGQFGSIELYADDEQLQAIEDALRMHREARQSKGGAA